MALFLGAQSASLARVSPVPVSHILNAVGLHGGRPEDTLAVCSGFVALLSGDVSLALLSCVLV